MAPSASSANLMGVVVRVVREAFGIGLSPVGRVRLSDLMRSI
jgi:hypothetical protein